MDNRELKPGWPRATLALTAFVILSAIGGLPRAQAQIDVTQVELVNAEDYHNGASEDYWYDIAVTGTGIASVQVTNQDGAHSFTLAASGGGVFENDGTTSYSTLADLRSVFPTGNYTFNVNNGAMTFVLNCSGVQPTAVAGGLAPADATSVSLAPTLSWSAVPASAGIRLHTKLWSDVGNGSLVAQNIYTLPTQTSSWTPSVGMNQNADYSWEVDVDNGTSNTMRVGSDQFIADSVFSYCSLADFTTKACIPGDINGDGLVDVADYNIWAANVGKTGATWSQGDLNGDGLVDVADYNIWAANVGKTASTPEPATLSLLALGGMALLRRRAGHGRA
jgi:hypothetical protein